MKKKPKILTFVGFYLPGYKAGGPLRTIANMVEHLSNEFDFWIITRDRDLGDTLPYSNIELDTWKKTNKANIFYLSKEGSSAAKLVSLIKSTDYDVLYLNSFFDMKFTVIPLLARYFNLLPTKPVILAPRGEFSKNALKIKKHRKSIYLSITKFLGLYEDITWQASSNFEADDISLTTHNAKINIALDLPALAPTNNLYSSDNNCDDVLKVIFLSRISPIKNLDFSLRILAKVKVKIIFNIYGPVENLNYWVDCKNVIKTLPGNIKVNYCGAVTSQEVASVFSKHDLFLFPSQGENYGHVIAEALSVGTPVLLSNNTPWRNLEKEGVGWNASLNNLDSFVSVIESYAKTTSTERNVLREYIKKTTLIRLKDPDVLKANIALFLDAM